MDKPDPHMLHKLWTLLAGTLLMFFAGTSWAFALQVDLCAQARVSADEITLKDVAQLNPPTPQLEDLRIGRSPSAGDSRDLDRDFVARALQRAGLNPTDIKMSGAEVVRVTRDGQRISSADIKASIADYLEQERKRLPDVDIHFEIYREPEAFVAPRGKLDVEVIPAADNLFSSRSMTLIYRVDGRVVNNLTLRGNIVAEADVVVANARIRRGDKIQPDDVELMRCDITDTSEPVFTLAEVVGMELGRSVRAGEPIERDHLQPPVIIERRGYVKIIAERGPMRLEATGTAMEDGRLGETIRVRNSSSLEEIHAQVVGANTVKVRF